MEAMLVFWEYPDLTPAARLMGLKLADKADYGREFAVSTHELMEWGGFSRVEMAASLRQLEDASLVRYTFGHSEQIGGTVVVGRVIFPCVDDAPEYARGDSPEWKKRRNPVMDKTGGLCFYCGVDGTGLRLQIDHMHPRSRGGSNKLENLIPACAPCNMKKRALTVDEFRERCAEAAGVAAQDYLFHGERVGK